jgi:hypothetical protein
VLNKLFLAEEQKTSEKKFLVLRFSGEEDEEEGEEAED